MKLKNRSLFLICAIFALSLIVGYYAVKSDYKVKVYAEQNAESSDGATSLHTHCYCGAGKNVGDHESHIGVTYQPWSGDDFNFDGGDKGVAYIYLSDDVVTDAHSCNRTDGDGILSVSKEQTIYLCLNGHSLKNGLTDNNSIDVSGTLILCDCVGGGRIGGRTSGSNSGSVWVSDGKFDMYGGLLTGSHGVKNGGGMYVKGASKVRMYGGKVTENVTLRQAGGVFVLNTSEFVMFGGEISNNSAPDFGGGVIVDDGSSFVMNGGSIENNFSGTYGGGVFVSGGTFTMNGGTIKGNQAANGGGVSVTCDINIRGSFTMNGGSISDNSAFSGGGGVYVWDRGDFTMNGGSIDGNKAVYGGGLCMYSANEDNKKINNVFNFSGGKIKNNSADAFGGGICCMQYSVLKFDGKEIISICDNVKSNLYFADKTEFTINNLIKGSSIGVSVSEKIEKGKPKIIYSATDTDFSEFFFSDDADYVIKSGAGGIELTADFFTSTINYVTSDGHVVPSQTVKGFEESLNLVVTDEKPTIPCHTFSGWAETEGSETVAYEAGDVITVIGEKTLYAVWKDAPHNLTVVAEVKATCTDNGVNSYYECSSCGKKFIDGLNGEKSEVTNDDQLVILAGHKFGPWQEAIAATTEKSGAIAHKDCTVCGKHFDSDGKEIDNITVEKLPDDTPSDQASDKKGCSGSATSDGAILVIAFTALAFALLKREKN